MADIRALRPALPILIGAALMLSLSMGLRQSLGLFMLPLTREVSISVSDFTLAIAVQNLAWGFLQPVAGALVVRLGYRLIMLTGAVMYIAGLLVLANAGGMISVTIGAGILIGISLACTASAVSLSVATRAVSPESRSMVLGIVSAAGSLGALVAAPLGQLLADAFSWRAGVIGFAVLALAMVPAAWIAGRVDKIPLPPPRLNDVAGESSAKAALLGAMKDVRFLIMAAAFFVCGMQLIFITTHLPAYLAICGMDPMLSAKALGMIGGFNVLGSLFFGWAGGKWNKLALLGSIYIARSLVLGWYFMSPPSADGTLLFAGLMGFLWLGVSPLVAGAVAEMFGLRWQAMIQGVAFVSHQLGSFMGAYGGGVLFDALGSYNLAWQIGVTIGLTAGAAQIISAFAMPSRPQLAAR